MDAEKSSSYTIAPIDSASPDKVIKERNPSIIDAGDIDESGNVAVMIENTLIALKINQGEFDLTGLDVLLTTCLNEHQGNVVSSQITLKDTKQNKVPAETQQEYIPTNGSFYIRSYVAERKIEIPGNSFIIRAKYRIKQPSYLKRSGFVTVASFVASIVVISVLLYLLLPLRLRYMEVSNLERSFQVGDFRDLKSPLAYVFFCSHPRKKRRRIQPKRLRSRSAQTESLSRQTRS